MSQLDNLTSATVTTKQKHIVKAYRVTSMRFCVISIDASAQTGKPAVNVWSRTRADYRIKCRTEEMGGGKRNLMGKFNVNFIVKISVFLYN